MRARLRELIYGWELDDSKIWIPYYDSDASLERLIDILLANGVIAPPVKVGDYVYYIKGGYYAKPENCKVSQPCKVVEISIKLQRSSGRVMRGFITDNGTRYSFDSIGKSVFLTEEDAINELKERRGNEQV